MEAEVFLRISQDFAKSIEYYRRGRGNVPNVVNRNSLCPRRTTSCGPSKMYGIRLLRDLIMDVPAGRFRAYPGSSTP
jgi:hypothetical protein